MIAPGVFQSPGVEVDPGCGVLRIDPALDATQPGGDNHSLYGLRGEV